MSRVSVIIPAYNSSKTIGRAIDSVLNQNGLVDFEIIVVNDGSTDDTSILLDKFYRNKLVVVNQLNSGPVAAANIGFKTSRADFVIKLDSDDEFFDTILFKMSSILNKKRDVDFVYCDYVEKEEMNKKIIRVDNLFKTVSIGIMFRRLLLKEANYYNNIGFSEYDLLLRTMNKWKGYRICEPLFVYNRRADSITSDKKWVEKELEKLLLIHPKKKKYIERIRGY